MLLSTLNLMRPHTGTLKRNDFFHTLIAQQNPDILILTETNDIIHPGDGYHHFGSNPLPGQLDGFAYKQGERRVSVFSKYPLGQQYEVADPYTAAFNEIITTFGPLIVYATIIGISGEKDQRFTSDMQMQQNDFQKLAATGRLCIAGDFNISFSGFPYPSNNVRNEFSAFLQQNNMTVLTADIPDVPDHIAISKNFISDLKHDVFHVPIDKNYSDHDLVSVKLRL